MIKLFNTTDNLFISNGDKVIIPLKAEIHKEDGGDFYLNIETDLSYINDLQPNKILVANTPQGDQAFRITNITTTRSKISIRANHIFYDSENYVIADSYVVDKTCNDAMDHLNSATDNDSPFTMISDITAINSYRCVRKTLYEALQVVQERWGGHLVRDNFNIGIMSSIGADNGVVIRYGKNLKNITAEYKWDNVVTKILPVGSNGLTLPEIYITSQTQYDIPYTKTISFDQSNIIQDDYETEEEYLNALIQDLREKAGDYLEENSVPKVNYKLSANVERITDIGDTIQVIDERLGIELLTNLISYDYDCILEKYIQVEFGNFTPTLNNLINTISENTDKQINEKNSTLRVQLGEQLEEATAKIWGALGNSYVIYDGDKILIVDKLPKETATNVIMINSAGIGFSNTGITGSFKSAWTIDNQLNMENINVINFTANLIKGGTLKLGSNLNENGQIEVYDEANNLIAELNKNGLKMYGKDGDYILMNNDVGFAGYDINDNKVYWVDRDEFHQRKSVVEEEITIGNKIKIIPIQNSDNDGIGFVGVA